MGHEKTRIEKYAPLRKQINREIELDRFIIHEQKILNNYLRRLEKIDIKHFNKIVDAINNDWEVINIHLHQDQSKQLIDSEDKYEINRLLNELVKYQASFVKFDKANNNPFEKVDDSSISLINNRAQYQENIIILEKYFQELQNKITETMELVYQGIQVSKTKMEKNKVPLLKPEQRDMILQKLAKISVKIDDQFNRLSAKFKQQKFKTKWILISTITSIIVVVILIILFIIFRP